MSIHINAKKGEVAGTVLLPGDPLRAKYIAEKFLSNVSQYNSVRGMLGYTGITVEGLQISVQGSGMGMPSLGIYVNELIEFYGVETIIRVGTCGALRSDIHLRDVILAQGSCTDSGTNRRRFAGMDFAPICDWDLLRCAFEAAEKLGVPVRVGNILATDRFYNDTDPNEWELWARYGVLAVEMESAELYTLAALHKVRALSILSVSDNLASQGEHLSPLEREASLDNMVQIALNLQ